MAGDQYSFAHGEGTKWSPLYICSTNVRTRSNIQSHILPHTSVEFSWPPDSPKIKK